MKEKVPVSVLVLTKNDEARIARCLESVRWADEILVVDDESTDHTQEIVRKYTDRILTRKMLNEGAHRNWAHAQCRNTWILDVDSDEVVTPELKEEIERVLQGNPRENGFTIPRRNLFGDYWVKYGGQYPAPQLKLFKKDKFKFEEAEIHGRAFMDPPCGHLKGDIIHYTYRDFEESLRKLNRQTTLEALKWRRNNKYMGLGKFTWRAVDRFIRTYVRKQGYKDGYIGFLMAFNASLYQVISYLKFHELKRQNASGGENASPHQNASVGDALFKGKRSVMKAVFLDRDGVINKYPGNFEYVKSWQEFEFLPGVHPALKKLADAGFKLFVISNQAGVAKKIYSQETLDQITDNMRAELNRHGIAVEGVYYCTHLPDAGCSCRKPKAGLLEQAVAESRAKGEVIEFSASYFIGDSVRDVQTGKAMGLKTIMVFSGREKPENKNAWEMLPDFTAAGLSEAVTIILKK